MVDLKVKTKIMMMTMSSDDYCVLSPQVGTRTHTSHDLSSTLEGKTLTENSVDLGHYKSLKRTCEGFVKDYNHVL